MERDRPDAHASRTLRATVVGIVGDIRHRDRKCRRVRRPTCRWRRTDRLGPLVMRTAGDPAALLPAVKAAIWSVNKDQILWTDRTTLDSLHGRLDRAAPLQHGAARALRRAGPGDLRRRDLRRDGLHRVAAHARDRRAHGARRDARTGRRDGAGKRRRTGGGWAC